MSGLIREPRLPDPPPGESGPRGDYLRQQHAALVTELRTLRRHVADLLDRPVFYAYKTATQSINDSSWTVISWDTVSVDTHGGWASSKWTPPVEGWYQVNLSVRANSLDGVAILAAGLFKNGSNIFNVAAYTPSAGATPSAQLAHLVYLNGSTDYLEFKAWQNSGVASDVRGTGDGIDTVVSAMRVFQQSSAR